MAIKLKVSEKDVQNSCLEYLARKRYFFFRLNNMPVWSGTHFRSMGEYTPKGLPDCVLIKDGKFIGLEFKGSTGRLSADQDIVRYKIKEAGGDYHVIRSIDDLQLIGI